MRRFITFLVLLTGGHTGAHSQLSWHGPDQQLRLFPSDSSVLELHEPRHDLPCVVEPYKPQLGLDLMFHTGFRVRLPTKLLAGAEDTLTILFRVTAERRKQSPAYFLHDIRVPSLKQSRRGRIELTGAFLVGEGKYSVDWLMRDARERFCASFWNFEAKVGSQHGPTQIIAQDAIELVITDPFTDGPFIERSREERLLSIKLIVNLNQRTSESKEFRPTDRYGLAGILRMMNRHPRVGAYSVVACSLQTQQLFYRQDAAPHIDMRSLGEALDPSHLARVSVSQLAVNNDVADFLARLIAEESGKDLPDAFILVSPDCPLDLKIPREAVSHWRNRPVFYLNLHFSEGFVWRSPQDVFGRIARQLRGVEYAITQPFDLFNAWSEILSRTAGTDRP